MTPITIASIGTITTIASIGLYIYFIESYVTEMLELRVNRLILFFLCTGVAFFFFFLNSFKHALPFAYFSTTILLIVINHFLLKTDFLETWYVILNLVLVSVLAQGIFLNVTALLTGNAIVQIINNDTLFLLSMPLCYLTTFFLLYIANRFYNISSISRLFVNRQHLNNLTIIISITFGIALLILFLSYLVERASWLPIIFLILFLFLLLIDITLFNYFVRTSVLTEYKIKASVFEKQILKQVESYLSLKEFVADFKSFKHDFEKIKRTILILIEQDNASDGIRNLLRELNESITEIDSHYIAYSNHPFVQAMLTDLHQTCKRNNIKDDLFIAIPQNLNLTDLEICKVFSNLIDNAIDSCLQVDSNRYIILKSKITQSRYHIYLENTCPRRETVGYSRFNLPKTTKTNVTAHGFGLKSIEQIITTKGGSLSLKIEATVFKTSIYLPLELSEDHPQGGSLQ